MTDMTEDQIKQYEKVQAQLDSLHLEIGGLAKKSHNDALNKFKLRFVNQSLLEANDILGDEYRPFKDFEKFEDEDLPSNSDVTLIIGQYLNCLENLRSDNIQRKEKIHNYKLIGYDWYWKQTTIKTAEPKKLKKS